MGIEIEISNNIVISVIPPGYKAIPRVLGGFVLNRMVAHQIPPGFKTILTSGQKDDASDDEKGKLRDLYVNAGRRMKTMRDNRRKATSSKRVEFLSKPFFTFDLLCGSLRLLGIQSIWALKIVLNEKTIENRPFGLVTKKGNAENCWIPIAVSASLANGLKTYLRLSQTPESMPTKLKKDRERKKFRNYYDSMPVQWKEGGEFAGKV